MGEKNSNRYCSVPECTQTARKGISFHYFPKDKTLQNEWSRILGINKPISKYMNVCCMHFTEHDYFYPNLYAGKRYLKKGAIPSQKLPKTSSEKNMISSPRQIRLKRRQVLKEESVTSVSGDENNVEVSNATSEQFSEKKMFPPPKRLKQNEITPVAEVRIVKLENDPSTSTIKENSLNINQNKSNLRKRSLEEKVSPPQKRLKSAKILHTEQKEILKEKPVLPTSTSESIEEKTKDTLQKKLIPPKKLVKQINTRKKEQKLDLKEDAPTSISADEDNEEISQSTIQVVEDLLSTLKEEPLKKYLQNKGIRVINTTEESKNEQKKVTLEDMLETNADVMAFTGISSIQLLDRICDAAKKMEKEKAKELSLPLRQRVILVFAKLKTNLSFLCLAVLFGISANECKQSFHITLEVLYEVLRHAVPWLEKEVIMKGMPDSFKKFRNTRVVLNCMEIALEKNKCLKCHSLKVLIGIAPSGLITFVSSVYGGRITDKVIFAESNILNKLIPYQDAVMVGKGFSVENECMERNITLIRPPVLGKSQQASAENVRAAEIAAARVHVKRTIQRLKVFKILKERVNLYMVPYMDSIINILAGVVNLSAPILRIDIRI